MSNHSLETIGIKNATVHWNLSPEQLSEISINKGMAVRADSGAIAINTGEFTGRSPKDRFIVKDSITKDKVWWGDINIPFDPDKFDRLYNKVVDYLSGKEIYARDGYANADPRYRLSIRFVNEYPWSNLFTHNMFIRPSSEELKNFENEWLVVNAPGFKADPEIDGTRQHNFAILNFERKIALVGGTGYTGEIKKGIFSSLNFLFPTEHDVLPMHCSANIGDDGDTAIFFGLSGTGKTTLSADPNRKLIGDDEHGWYGNTVFNFEGGCYAKVIDLTEENEPDIYRAIKPNALLENVKFKSNGVVDFSDDSITPNTRVSYPIDHIDNIAEPSIGSNPKNIFFLTADAFGVLPPISKLTAGQAAYHFISGYTAKVAGTEAGVTEPQTVFSACFGAPFMPLHPGEYAKMLSEKINAEGTKVWLVNTGWTGGEYGVGSRIKLRYTRAMISAALRGDLDNVDYIENHIFGLKMPIECPDVPNELLDPRTTWDDIDAYDKKAEKLSKAFHKNFEQFKSGVNENILAGAPKIV